MEGSRLILKRKVETKKRLLFIALGLGLCIVFVMMVVQLKTTLSAHTLSAVKEDVAKMRSDFAAEKAADDEVMVEGEVTPTEPSSLDKLKAAFEEAIKPTPPEGEATTADTETPEPSTTPPVEGGETPNQP